MDPPRRSRRLAEEDPEEHTLSPPPKRLKTLQSATPGDSRATTSTEDLGDGSGHGAARRIIAAYTSSRGRQDEKLAKCLNALLDFLPSSGATRVSNDILRCGDDNDKLFEVFENLCTGLLVPSKYIICTSEQ